MSWKAWRCLSVGKLLAGVYCKIGIKQFRLHHMTESVMLVVVVWRSALLGSLLLRQDEIKKSGPKIDRELYFEVFFRPDFFYLA